MRSKKVVYNIITNLILQIIVIIYGLIIPRIIISQYGSEVNGLVASITQYLSCISLLEVGFGPVIMATLYKPIAQNKIKEIKNILNYSQSFFRKIAYIFIIYVIILCILYPLLVNNIFDTLYTISLIIIISVSTFIEYYFGMTYRLFLQSKQKDYIISTIQIILHILSITIILIAIKCNASIHILKLVSGIVFIIRPIIQNIYVKKKYNIVLKDANDKYELKNKWNGLAQHIAFIIHSNTDIVILTIFCSLKEVSVYSIYYLVIKSIKHIIQAFTNSIKATFGNMIAKNENDNLNNKFNIFETIYFTICTILFTCTMILIVPFVSVYTKGITDVNYIRYTFGYLIVISEFIWGLRLPFSTLAITAGHFKETRNGAWIEATINIILSIILVIKYGLIGVIIGTIIAMTIRTIEFIYHTNKYILKRSIITTIKKLLLVIIEAIICVFISKYLFITTINSYFSWLLNAIIIFITTSIIIVLINYIIYKDEYKNLFKIIKELIKKQ